MVVGAGRGPLVRSTINASKTTKRKIQIFVIEKNPNAVVTLQALKEELWPNDSESPMSLVKHKQILINNNSIFIHIAHHRHNDHFE